LADHRCGSAGLWRSLQHGQGAHHLGDRLLGDFRAEPVAVIGPWLLGPLGAEATYLGDQRGHVAASEKARRAAVIDVVACADDGGAPPDPVKVEQVGVVGVCTADEFTDLGGFPLGGRPPTLGTTIHVYHRSIV